MFISASTLYIQEVIWLGLIYFQVAYKSLEAEAQFKDYVLKSAALISGFMAELLAPITEQPSTIYRGKHE